jgi:hypothetical protein
MANPAVPDAADRLLPIQQDSQATLIETGRAMAEVRAMVMIAQQFPRSEDRALTHAVEACKRPDLAGRAFYRFPRGKTTVTGPTIYLARELARIWGNFTHGTSELARHADRSEVLAFAWDIELNVRVAHTFINPHRRDKRDEDGGSGSVVLTTGRDIREMNANIGARTERSAILQALPPHYVDAAVARCHQTLREGKDETGRSVPLQERIRNMLHAFRELGVTEDDVVRKLDGRPSRKWDEYDIANLGVIFRSIKDGEIARDAEFPRQTTVTRDDLPPAQQTPNGEQPALADVWPETEEPSK